MQPDAPAGRLRRGDTYRFGVELFTSEWLLQGFISPPLQERLTDTLNRPGEHFLTIEECTIRAWRHIGEEYASGRTAFVRRAALLLAIPHGDVSSRDRIFMRATGRFTKQPSHVELALPSLLVRGLTQARGLGPSENPERLKTVDYRNIEYTQASPFVPITQAEIDYYNLTGRTVRRESVVIINMNSVIASFALPGSSAEEARSRGVGTPDIIDPTSTAPLIWFGTPKS